MSDWEKEFDKRFVIRVLETGEVLDWQSPNKIPEAKDFIRNLLKEETKRARLEERSKTIEQVKDLLDEFNDMKPNAINFGLRISKVMEFAKRLEALKSSLEEENYD